MTLCGDGICKAVVAFARTVKLCGVYMLSHYQRTATHGVCHVSGSVMYIHLLPMFKISQKWKQRKGLLSQAWQAAHPPEHTNQAEQLLAQCRVSTNVARLCLCYTSLQICQLSIQEKQKHTQMLDPFYWPTVLWYSMRSAGFTPYLAIQASPGG